MQRFDAVVIGGGHAGVEASLALARLNKKTLMLCLDFGTVSLMPCNPAIGGTAKGHLVKEIDALGGQMGLSADKALLQIKTLNSAKGPAVFSLRGQEDKAVYHELMLDVVKNQENLTVLDKEACEVVAKGGKVCTVRTTDGEEYECKAVVLATGVYLNGAIIIGDYVKKSGPSGFASATHLTDSLVKLGVQMRRFKTGTPARIYRDSIDFSKMEIQRGDDSDRFSFMSPHSVFKEEPCWLTYTNAETHRVILDNIDRSPLYNGTILSVGPRYCPSIETKVMRFKDKERHQIFVEPEGIGTEEMYLNGLSSSLPEEVQHRFIRTLPGLRHVEIMRPAYAVEYDYLDPMDLLPSLESKIVDSLFIAGQTNGTSGYEEAASQGLIAGLNACQKLKGERAVVLGRTDAYIGVLIDDLVTKGTKEPYRMFTSRAEYRLSLRHDSADIRLTPIGYQSGLVSEEKMARLKDKIEKMDEVKELLRQSRVAGKNGLERLVQSENNIFSMDEIPELKNYSEPVLNEVMLDVKYSGYLKRQEIDCQRAKKQESIHIPEDFDYDSVDGLSAESKEKFKKMRPSSVGQAGRISGVRVSDTAILALALSGKSHAK